MPLIVGKLEEVFAAQCTVILFAFMTLLVLLQSILNFKLLSTRAAGIRLLMHRHVYLQFFKTTKGFITLWAGPLVFFHMYLQVFVEVFHKGKVCLTIRARETLPIRCFPMSHYVPFQVIHSAEFFAAVATDEASRTRRDLLV